MSGNTFTYIDDSLQRNGEMAQVSKVGSGQYSVQIMPADSKSYSATVNASNRWDAVQQVSNGFEFHGRSK